MEETEETLLGNARLKAAALVKETAMAAIAEDTGIEVEALGGAPGVRSARFAGEPPDEQANVDKVLAELAGRRGPEQRRARFVTVAVAIWPDGREVSAEGTVEGWIAEERRGSGGFGYDPVFVPSELDGRTFGEIAEALARSQARFVSPGPGLPGAGTETKWPCLIGGAKPVRQWAHERAEAPPAGRPPGAGRCPGRRSLRPQRPRGRHRFSQQFCQRGKPRRRRG